MEKLILKDAFKNNDIISFKKKDNEGLELWYSGHITNLTDNAFEFSSVYGKNYTFMIRDVKDLKGARVSYSVDPLNTVFQKNKEPRVFIVFDTETTGLPKNWNAPVTDTENWPRVLQLAWSIHDEEGKELEHRDILIKPEGFFIPLETVEIHGITTEKAMEEGISLTEALDIFSKVLERSDVMVAHNISFDEMVLGCEYYRMNIPNPIEEKTKICTKEASVNFCRIPGRGGRYSWASLDQLYTKLFNTVFENQHNASNDVKACVKCFFELKRLGVIE
jgi:DNA polymerase III epsilon subunit-like protein